MSRLALAMLCALMLSAPAYAAPAGGTLDGVRSYRARHAAEIVDQFSALLALPDVATDVAAMERNADLLEAQLQRRGVKTRRLSAGPGAPPSVYGELKVKGARRTVLFYAHFDGQPVAGQAWRSPPFSPVVRAGAGPEAAEIDWRHAAAIDPEWRIFARSAGDDKATIQALLSALDALKATGRRPSVNVKVLFEGEEEQNSPHLPAILQAHRDLLGCDLMVLGDGPVNASGRAQVFYGARGLMGLEMTAFGPLHPVHDGHYGNWAPNPAVMLAHAIAAMRAEDGRITIPGFSDDVRPLGEAERAALARAPDSEDGLRRELALGRTELDPRLLDATSAPSLNVRGLQAGQVGAAAANAVPSTARASLDFRLVPDQRPAEVRRRIEAFLESQGWFVTAEAPDEATLRSHPKVMRLQWVMGYPAYRTDLGSPQAAAVRAAVGQGAGAEPVDIPLLGGSVPMSVFFDAIGAPVIGVPIANHDDNQHAADENLRIGNLWTGIDIYAALLTLPDWRGPRAVSTAGG